MSLWSVAIFHDENTSDQSSKIPDLERQELLRETFLHLDHEEKTCHLKQKIHHFLLSYMVSK
jgi:hypothetical protein